MNTTEKRLIAQTENIHRLCVEQGILYAREKTHLEIGSKYYGRAFRIYLLGKMGKGSGLHAHPLGNYLGMTKSEASDALGHIQTVLYAVADRKRQRTHRK